MQNTGSDLEAHMTVRLPRSCQHCSRGNIQATGAVPEVLFAVDSAQAVPIGWRLEGTGHFHFSCPTCGDQLAAVEKRIPIQCRGLICPKCKKADRLTVTITDFQTANESFAFSATLECDKCKRKNVFKQVVSKLASILSIEIGPGGVTIKGASKDTSAT
jgi:predicted RNA-binding Zn-ribbon protein involved in translation (DUF1610 family)